MSDNSWPLRRPRPIHQIPSIVLDIFHAFTLSSIFLSLSIFLSGPRSRNPSSSPTAARSCLSRSLTQAMTHRFPLPLLLHARLHGLHEFVWQHAALSDGHLGLHEILLDCTKRFQALCQCRWLEVQHQPHAVCHVLIAIHERQCLTNALAAAARAAVASALSSSGAGRCAAVRAVLRAPSRWPLHAAMASKGAFPLSSVIAPLAGSWRRPS